MRYIKLIIRTNQSRDWNQSNIMRNSITVCYIKLITRTKECYNDAISLSGDSLLWKDNHNGNESEYIFCQKEMEWATFNQNFQNVADICCKSMENVAMNVSGFAVFTFHKRERPWPHKQGGKTLTLPPGRTLANHLAHYIAKHLIQCIANHIASPPQHREGR